MTEAQNKNIFLLFQFRESAPLQLYFNTVWKTSRVFTSDWCVGLVLEKECDENPADGVKRHTFQRDNEEMQTHVS